MSQQQFMVGSDHSLPIEPLGGSATVLVESGDTVYYADNSQVSASNNQGTIVLGDFLVFSSGAWVRSAGLSAVLVTYTPSDGTGSGGSGGAQIAGDLGGTLTVPVVNTVKGGQTPLTAERNLNDVGNSSTARANLGLGTAAILNVGGANGVANLDVTGNVPAGQLGNVVNQLPVPAIQGASGTNLGATQTINFGSTVQEVWLVGTLNANLTVTVSNRVSGCRAVLYLTQDLTGGRTLTISDGSNSRAVSVTATAGVLSVVEIRCPDSTAVEAVAAGGDPPVGGDASGTQSNMTVNTVLGGKTPLSPGYSDTGAGGYLAAVPAFHWRGAWAASTAYLRGDVVVDPFGVLRWCGVAHTSPTTFSTGTEYSAQVNWWHQIPTNGPFRGPYTTAHTGTAIQYTQDDLVLDPNTGLFTRALYEDSNNNGTFLTGRFGDLGVKQPFVHVDTGIVLPPSGMPNSKIVQGHGLWRKQSKLVWPHAKPIAIWNTSANFTSTSNGTVTADIDPVDPNGNPKLAFSTSSALYTTQLAAPVDLSTSIVRLLCKLTGDRIQSGASHQVGVLGSTLTLTAKTSLPLDTTGLWYGCGPGTQIQITDGGTHTDTFTVSDYVSASAGGSVTQIPIVSQTPTFAYTSSTAITTVSRTAANRVALQVSSDNFATKGSELILKSSAPRWIQGDTCWWWVGGGSWNWTTVSGLAAATMTAINAVRIQCLGAGTIPAGLTLSVARLEAIPANGQTGSKGDGRAKLVWWGDDSPEAAWTLWVGSMIQQGFPGTLAAGGAIDTSSSALSFAQLKHLCQFHGWQAAIHYYFANDGGEDQTKEGLAKETFLMRARHSLIGAGLWGTDDFAWHDDDGPSSANMPTMYKYCRAVRGYNTAVQTSNYNVQTLPPVNPHYVEAYGIGGGDEAGTIGTTASQLNSGVAVTAVPLAAALTVDVALGEQMTLGASGPTVTCSAYTSAGATTIPIQSFTPASNILSATAVVNPGSTIKGMMMTAIANKGLLQIVYDPAPVALESVQMANNLAFLDQNRASIDVVTFAEALAPWTVTA